MSSLAENFTYHFAGRRRAIWTSNKELFLCPQEARVGDIIAIFLGGDGLYVLRPTNNRGFLLIGTTYNYNLMCGSALQEHDWKVRVTNFRVI
jgi:hypothetical protein